MEVTPPTVNAMRYLWLAPPQAFSSHPSEYVTFSSYLISVVICCPPWPLIFKGRMGKIPAKLQPEGSLGMAGTKLVLGAGWMKLPVWWRLMNTSCIAYEWQMVLTWDFQSISIYFNWISRKGTWDILSLVFFFWAVAASPMCSELQWLISTRAMWQAYHHVVPYSEKSSSSSSTQCCRIWYAHLVALGCCFLPLITVIMPSMKQHETSKNHSWDYVIQHEYFGACDWCWITGSGAGFIIHPLEKLHPIQKENPDTSCHHDTSDDLKLRNCSLLLQSNVIKATLFMLLAKGRMHSGSERATSCLHVATFQFA